MHGLVSTDCTQPSLCGCTRPGRANRFMLHIAAYYVMHCQLPNTKVSRGAACSLSQLARGTQMHGLLGTDCTQAWSFGCISPEGLSYCLGVCGPLPSPRHQSNARCSLFGLSGGKGTHRCMACPAQIAHRHRCVDALGPRGRITSCCI